MRQDYFQPPDILESCKIVYDTTNEQWEVLWHEFGKLNGKPFPIKKYGMEAAKIEAINFANDLNVSLDDICLFTCYFRTV